MVELLLSKGADPTKRDGNGQSAADLARSMNAADTPFQLEAAERLARLAID
jgi:ankyrin repeat protein